MLIKPEIVRINASTIAGLNFENVIYGERSQAGAMGNAGGIMLYELVDGKFTLYRANLHTDEQAYSEGLFKIAANEFMFDTYQGGMGNGVFIKKGVKLVVIEEDKSFWYIKDDQPYRIKSSVRGVFDAIAKAILTGHQDRIDPMQDAWETRWRDEF